MPDYMDKDEDFDIDELARSLENVEGISVEDAPEYVPSEEITEEPVDENYAPEVVITETKKRLNRPTPQTLREMECGKQALASRYGPIITGPKPTD